MYTIFSNTYMVKVFWAYSSSCSKYQKFLSQSTKKPRKHKSGNPAYSNPLVLVNIYISKS